TTMSVASADIDNDLRPELYLGQIGDTHATRDKYRDVGPDLCDEITHPGHRKSCREMMRVHQIMPGQTKKQNVFRCMSGAAPDFRQDCIAYALLLRARGDGPRRMCDLFPASWEIFRFNCHQSYDEKLTVEPVKTQPDPKSGPGRDDGGESVPVIFGRNVLLAATGEGRFTDKAVE